MRIQRSHASAEAKTSETVRFRTIAVHYRTSSSAGRHIRAQTVHANLVAETEAGIRRLISQSSASPRTDCSSESRGTARFFPHLKQRLKSQIVGGGPSRNRTGVQGFAVLCVTTPPSGRSAPFSRLFADGQAFEPPPNMSVLSTNGCWRGWRWRLGSIRPRLHPRCISSI